MNGNIDVYLKLPNWIKERWWWVAYLIPPDPVRERFGDLIKIGLDERFNAFVTEQLEAVMKRGAMPPAEIAGPILNFADDLMAGRQVTLRSGDYIALQTYLRKTH